MIDKEIGRRIRKLREEQGISGEKLASKVEVTTKFMYEIENGKKGVSAKNLYKIATVLSTSCDYLLLGREKTDVESEVERSYSELLKGFDEKQRKIVIKILGMLLEYDNENPEENLEK